MTSPRKRKIAQVWTSLRERLAAIDAKEAAAKADAVRDALLVGQRMAAETQARKLQRDQGKNPAAVALGRLGGLARKAKLSEAQLSELGRRSAYKRYGHPWPPEQE